MEKPQPKLGIIAGGGLLPRIIIDELQDGREIFVIALAGECDLKTVENIPHEWANVAAVGKIIGKFKECGVREIVLAGSVKRPAFSSLRPDFESVKLLTRLLKFRNQGDNAILSEVMDYLEEQGFRVVGAHELLQNILVGEGALGKIKPDKQGSDDIALAQEILKATGKFDVGQAAIVQNGRVIGLEAVEGTDALIKRCAEYLRKDTGGVLVKLAKPGQDKRADLPTIGIATVENIAASGMNGIAVEAGSALVLDKDGVVKAADRLGVFVFGISPDGK